MAAGTRSSAKPPNRSAAVADVHTTSLALNADDLDPGIRQTVLWLREHGFETTDSGDGVSKKDLIASGDALDYPHVAIQVQPRALIDESGRLFDLLGKHGITPDSGTIQAMYAPADGIAVIMLMSVNDDSLAVGQKWVMSDVKHPPSKSPPSVMAQEAALDYLPENFSEAEHMQLAHLIDKAWSDGHRAGLEAGEQSAAHASPGERLMGQTKDESRDIIRGLLSWALSGACSDCDPFRTCPADPVWFHHKDCAHLIAINHALVFLGCEPEGSHAFDDAPGEMQRLAEERAQRERARTGDVKDEARGVEAGVAQIGREGSEDVPENHATPVLAVREQGSSKPEVAGANPAPGLDSTSGPANAKPSPCEHGVYSTATWHECWAPASDPDVDAIWRTGRKNPHTIYLDDEYAGTGISPTWASRLVVDANVGVRTRIGWRHQESLTANGLNERRCIVMWDPPVNKGRVARVFANMAAAETFCALQRGMNAHIAVLDEDVRDTQNDE